jgi:NAD(P)-dependent dehydrogenase (short-subunit alcohol dehydrogenase family)
LLGARLEEEVERVETAISATRSTSTLNSSSSSLGEDEPGQVVRLRILLPVDEVLGRLDLQRVGQDRVRECGAGRSRTTCGPSARWPTAAAGRSKGPFRLMSLVGSRMAAGEGGSIINISSAGALRPRPQIAPYAGAKAALNAITEAFAFEYGPKVRVNTISPGRFLTDVSKAWNEEHKLNSTAALKRSGRPEEIVTAALYLASSQVEFHHRIRGPGRRRNRLRPRETRGPNGATCCRRICR